MTAPFRIAALTAAASLAAGAASADLTPADVWAQWQDAAAGFGQTLTAGDEEASADRLTLRDVTIVTDGPDGGANATFPEIVMTAQGDGTVAIAMPSETPVDVTTIGPDDEVSTFTVVIDQSALDLVASGAPGAISYVYSAPEVTVRMTEAVVDGERMDLDARVAMTGLEGSYAVTDGDPREVASVLRAAAITLAASGTDPDDSGDTFVIGLDVADLVSESSGSGLSLMGMANLSEMVEAGLTSSGITTHGRAGFTLDGTSEGSAFSAAGSYGSGTYAVAIGTDGFDYDYSGRDFALTVSGDEIPLPEVAIAADEIGTRVAMPIGVSDEPEDVGFALRLVGLTLSEDIWAMFDPIGGLPRDPATLVLDIAARANWLVDVFDPAVSEAMMDEAPGEVHSVTVNELRLAALGALLTGTGAFDFDNTGPVPQPAGTMNLRLEGANALIDTLVNMGMLPQDQAMGARMMLGLFARPGDGPDTLVSEITVQPDGAVLANGQRIR